MSDCNKAIPPIPVRNLRTAKTAKFGGKDELIANVLIQMLRMKTALRRPILK